MSEKKLLTAFWLTLDQAILFYELCEEMKLETPEDRTWLLNVLAQNGAVEKVVQTGRSKEDYVKDLAKHFKVMKAEEKKEKDFEK